MSTIRDSSQKYRNWFGVNYIIIRVNCFDTYSYFSSLLVTGLEQSSPLVIARFNTELFVNIFIKNKYTVKWRILNRVFISPMRISLRKPKLDKIRCIKLIFTKFVCSALTCFAQLSSMHFRKSAIFKHIFSNYTQLQFF